jgi:glycosyltransferase involved in cell wall biosynthesis
MSEPRFSIVVPTYERPQQLGDLLASLERLEHPRDDYEVVVVDDGGNADVEAVVERHRSALDVTLIRASHRGCAGARQAGIDVARGTWIVFTDDDCRPRPDWLGVLAERLEQMPGAAVGGRVVNALDDNPYSAASQLVISYLYRVYNRDRHHARFFTTNNVAVPAAELRAVGGLDRAWTISGGEDRDLWQRWRKAGHGMVYAPEAVVEHAHRLTLTTMWRQHYHYGRGAYVYHSGCHAPDRRPVRFERLRFYAALPLHAWREERGVRAAVCAVLLVITQAANGAGWLREMMARRGLLRPLPA